MQHHAEVQYRPERSHGYPWRAVCWCGYVSQGYVAEHAAQGMADYHNKPVLTALANLVHCAQCGRTVSVSEPFAFRGMDRLRMTLSCGHVVARP